MGRQKSSSTIKNALITQFFKKPEANVKKQTAKNDENALTEQEIQERNRRLLQRLDEGDHKKKRPVLRPALSDKSGLGGGLGTKQTVKVPKRHEPTCNVLCDFEEPVKNVESSKTIVDMKERRAPLQEKQVEAKVPMPKSWSATSSNNTLDEESSSPTIRSRDKHDISETVDKDTSDSSSISPCTTKDESAARAKRRRIKEESITKHTLLPSSQQSEEEQHNGENETTDVNDKSILYPDEEEDDDDDAICPVNSPTFSENDSLPLSPEHRPSSPDIQQSSECSSSYESRSSIHNSSPDHTLPLSFTEQYEEHVAFPVPRGKSLIEKLGIQDHVSSQSSSHSTDNDEQTLA